VSRFASLNYTTGYSDSIDFSTRLFFLSDGFEGGFDLHGTVDPTCQLPCHLLPSLFYQISHLNDWSSNVTGKVMQLDDISFYVKLLASAADISVLQDHPGF
jgi:hypothetical protein